MQPSAGFESESLQADVMRFMAIIGFCLVAIFALVRNSDARPSAPDPETAAVFAAAATQPPVAAIEPPRPAPAPARSPAPATVKPTLPTPAAAAPEPSAAAPEPLEVTSASPPPTAVATEPGLSLSFRSDGDFLRLVGAGVVELYVMDAAAAEPTLRFDPHGEFTPARAPGRIYELLPGTIPETITTALVQRPAPAGPSGVLTWGVTLPPALERELAKQRDQHSQGTLLIDRHARIRHVPPA